MGLFKSEEEKRDIEKEKGLIDRELQVYRREEMARVQSDVNDARQEERKKLLDLAKENVKDAFELEHEFHVGAEKKRTELAKLDAVLENKKELVAKVDSIPELERRAVVAEAQAEGKEVAIEHLKADVTRLDDLVKFLAGMLPKIELDKLGITLNADVKVSESKK